MKEALTIGLLAMLLVGCTVVPPGTAGASGDVDVDVNVNATDNDNGDTNVNVNTRTVRTGPSEWDIRREINAANTCTVDADCAEVGSVCPFGCHISVNKAESARIQALLETYPSDCAYSCIAIDRIECISNRCMAVVGETPNDDTPSNST